MGYRWVEHTAEVGLEIEAPTSEAIFDDALHALGELIGDGSRGDPVACEIFVAGREPAVLLAGWLDELVYRAETEDLVPDDVERIELGEQGVRATVRCHRGSPRHLVKGVTYHQLAFEPTDRGFRATLVLDV
jgi:protein archease